MDNILCNGSETELSECRFDGWAQNDCDPSEAAGVICRVDVHKPHRPAKKKPSTKPPAKRPLHNAHHSHSHRRATKHHQKRGGTPEFRLAGGREPNEGRVEVRFGVAGVWGALCADGWSLLEANVACKSLGYGYANDALQTDFFNGGGVGDGDDDMADILLSGTECYGNETSLHECLHHTRVSCPGAVASFPQRHVAAVMCVEPMADLVFQHALLEESAHLEDRPLYWLQCAMEENCLASAAYAVQKDNPNWRHETRRLLKFTASVLNAGTADFRPSIPKHLWEWHMCHM